MSPKDWCVHGTGAHARPNPTSNYVDFAVENPRKLKEKQHKNCPRLEEVTTAIEKNPGNDPPAIVFFCSGSTLIQSRSILSCSVAEMRFLLFKWPGSFKKK
jgi:hypothetical protein